MTDPLSVTRYYMLIVAPETARDPLKHFGNLGVVGVDPTRGILVQADALVPDAGWVGASHEAQLEANPLVTNYAEAWGIVATSKSWWHLPGVADDAPTPAGWAVVNDIGEPYWSTRQEALAVEMLIREALQRAAPMEAPKKPSGGQ